MADNQKKTNTEIKSRWNKKTYTRYAINMRKDSDKDCIDFIEQEKKLGLTPTEIFKKLIRGEYD